MNIFEAKLIAHHFWTQPGGYLNVNNRLSLSFTLYMSQMKDSFTVGYVSVPHVTSGSTDVFITFSLFNEPVSVLPI
jgi:hypothetical protein